MLRMGIPCNAYNKQWEAAKNGKEARTWEETNRVRFSFCRTLHGLFCTNYHVLVCSHYVPCTVVLFYAFHQFTTNCFRSLIFMFWFSSL